MKPILLLFLFAFILSLPKVPHLVRWGFGKDRLRYIKELKSRGQYEAWQAKYKYYLLAENICTNGAIAGLFLTLIGGYFNWKLGMVFFIVTALLVIAGIIVSLALDIKIPPPGKT